MKRPREGPASGATLIRSLIVIPTGGMIVAGAVYAVRRRPPPSHGQFDANIFGLVAAALLPSVVHLLGVRTRRSSLIYGLLLLGVTALAWVPVFLVDDAMRGVLVFPAFFMTLTKSVLAGFERSPRYERIAACLIASGHSVVVAPICAAVAVGVVLTPPRPPFTRRPQSLSSPSGGGPTRTLSGMTPDPDDEWLEPDDQMGPWEYQVHPLAVGGLKLALTSLDDDLRVLMEFYGGSEVRSLPPMQIDLKGTAGTPSAIVITVA